jgi:hypothetical protein
MYKYILEAAGSLDGLALFALVTFFSIFSVSIYLACFSDKSKISKIASLPLADDDPEIN